MSPILILTDMLRRSREQFQFYGDQHMAKSPPQLEKAAVNYKFVAEINAALVMAETVRSPDNLPEAPHQ